MTSWIHMNKDQRKIYREHREEQRLIEAEKRELARKKAVASLLADGSLLVRTLDIEYTKFRSFGYGDCQFHIPPKLNLVIEAFGSTLAFRVDVDFRRAIGILLPKRRMLIRQAMPPSIELFLGIHPKYHCDQIYVSPGALSTWVGGATALIRPVHSQMTA